MGVLETIIVMHNKGSMNIEADNSRKAYIIYLGDMGFAKESREIHPPTYDSNYSDNDYSLTEKGGYLYNYMVYHLREVLNFQDTEEKISLHQRQENLLSLINKPKSA